MWRESYDLAADRAGAGYATERADFHRDHRPPTFRDYLVQMTGSGWPMSGSAPMGSRWAR